MPRHGQSTLAPQTLKRLLADAVDERHMLEVFQRILPPMATAPVRVVKCHARADKSRSSLRRKRRRINYRLTIDVAGTQRSIRLLGTMPTGPEFLTTELREACRRARGHATVGPFHELATFLPELHMGLQFFPVDVDLPQLLDVLRRDPAELIAPVWADHGGGAAADAVQMKVAHYKPARRAVLKFTVPYRDRDAGRWERVIYGKIFADERGAVIAREMQAVWHAAARTGRLRLPEPLGYDPRYHMVFMGEAQGARNLNCWVKCLEREQPLPPDTTLDRLERCLQSAAAALAELHRTTIDACDMITFADAVAQLQRDGIRSHRSHPEVAQAVDRIFEAILSLKIDNERLVPSHGAFRHTQLIGDESSLVVLDWDGLVLASPALDAATFISRLRHVPIMQPGRAVELSRLADVFRREFIAQSAGADLSLLAAYEALKLVDTALRTLRRGKSPDRAAAAAVLLLAEAHRLLESLERSHAH